MNDKVRYLVEMDPNMIKGIALFRLSFERGGNVLYDFADPQGEFQVLDESEWELLPQENMVEVTAGVVDDWKQGNPIGYNTVAKYVV